jgi:hypothetical protein
LNASSTSVASGTLDLTVGSTSSTASVPIPNTVASGNYTVSVTYSGDSNYLATSTATSIQVQVGHITPTVSLVSNSNPVLITFPVTFTETVASTAGTPSGSVGFYDGTTLLGSVTLSSGVASYTTSSLAVGTHSITAVYSGDSNFAIVTSSAVAELIQDFSVTSSGSGSSGSGSGSGSTGVPTQTAAPGGTATYSVSLGLTTGTTLPVPITMSVTGAPPGATATVSPSLFPANTPFTNVTLSVQLPATTAAAEPKEPLYRRVPSVLWGLLLLPFAGRLRRAGKRMRRTLTLLFVLAAGVASMVGLSGCGATSGFFGQQQKTYTLYVVATAGSVSHSTPVTLTVE